MYYASINLLDWQFRVIYFYTIQAKTKRILGMSLRSGGVFCNWTKGNKHELICFLSFSIWLTCVNSDCISSLPPIIYNTQGLINCLEIGLEILDLEAKEIEEYVFPILGWVAVCLAAILILGGVGIGLYLRHRYCLIKKSNPYIKIFLNTYAEGTVQSPPHLGWEWQLNWPPPTPIWGAHTPRSPWPPSLESPDQLPNSGLTPVYYIYSEVKKIQSEFTQVSHLLKQKKAYQFMFIALGLITKIPLLT